jgi:hypothetical protein
LFGVEHTHPNPTRNEKHTFRKHKFLKHEKLNINILEPLKGNKHTHVELENKPPKMKQTHMLNHTHVKLKFLQRRK